MQSMDVAEVLKMKCCEVSFTRPQQVIHASFFVLSSSQEDLSFRSKIENNGGMFHPPPTFTMPQQPARPTSALIVIDVQQSFAHMPFWAEGDVAPFQEALLKLEAGCRAAKVPVVHIFHAGREGPFRPDSGYVEPLDWLPANPAVRITKHTHNAFTDTGLDLWLRRQGVQRLIISGIRTEQCCETTARVGADIGYVVDFVSEATLTFPMQHPHTGRTYSAQDITAHTELVLTERFARIATVDTCLSSL